MSREIILDTETTGLDPFSGHKIIEIGAIEMINKVLTGKKFHYYINPQRNVPNEAYRIHGIGSEFLKDKPLFKDIASEFTDFIMDSKLVIHNAPFDIGFLNNELSFINLENIKKERAIDTLILAKKMFPESRVNLDALCKRFKVDNSSRNLHGALKDAALLAEVYVELTGGRQRSFSMASSKSEKIQSEQSQNAIGNKLVIFPTKEERNKHKEFIKELLS